MSRSCFSCYCFVFPPPLLRSPLHIWLFPVSLVHGEHIWPTAGILAPTAVFIGTDAHSAPPFRNTTDFNGFNNTFSSLNSAAIIAGVPGIIYGVGLLHKDSYTQESALLAAQAVADEFIVYLPVEGDHRAPPAHQLLRQRPVHRQFLHRFAQSVS
jgi:hypothetical protein